LSCVDLAIGILNIYSGQKIWTYRIPLLNVQCVMKSIECSHIQLHQDDYSRFTSDTLTVTRIRNRNKVLDKASRACEQLTYFIEMIIVKGLLDMDRTE
jgi:hypothetical protein